ENDLKMLRSSFFVDPAVFSLDKMQRLLSVSRPYRSDLSWKYVQRNVSVILTDPILVPGCLVIAILAYFIDGQKLGYRRLILLSGALLAVALYLLCFMKLPQYVYFCLLAFLVLMVLFYTDTAKLETTLRSLSARTMGKWFIAGSAAMLLCTVI